MQVLPQLLIQTDHVLDFVPGFSTVSNLIDLFQKCVVLPLMQKSVVWNNRYFTHLQQKSFVRCILLMIPILGNILIAIYDYASRMNNDKKFVLEQVEKAGSNLRFASSQLQNDEEVVKAAVSNDGLALKYASERLRNDKDIVEIACNQDENAVQFASAEVIVQKGGNYIEFIGPVFQDNKKIMLALIKDNPHAFKHASSRLKNNRAMVLAALSMSMVCLEYASDKFKNDRAFMLAAANKDIEVLQYANDALLNDFNFAKKALQISPEALGYMSSEIQGKIIAEEGFDILNLKHLSKEVMLEFIQKNGLLLRYAGEYRKDEDVVAAAVSENKHALQFADYERVRAILRENGRLLEFVSNAEKDDILIVSSAVKQDGMAIQFASPAIKKKNSSIILAAVEQNGLALQFTGQNHQIALAAVTQNAMALDFVFKNDAEIDFEAITAVAVEKDKRALRFASREFVLNSVTKDGGMFQFASETHRSDFQIFMAVFNKNREAIAFATGSYIKNNKKIVLDAVTKTGLLLQYASDDLRKDKDVQKAARDQDSRASQYFL